MGWIDGVLSLIEQGAGRIANKAAAMRHPDPAAPPAPAAAAPHAEEPRATGAAALTNHIRNMVRAGGVTGGAVHFLNLAEVRARFADRWPIMASRVAAVSESVLEHRLARIDMFTRLEGPAYLIVFANGNEDAARLRCALIGQEIQRQLFGEDTAFNDVRVRASVFRLGREVRVEHIDLDAAIERLRPVEPMTPVAPDDWPSPAVPPPAAIAEMLAGEAGSIDGRPTRYVFRPMLHVRAEAVASFFCQPQHRAVDNDDDFVACTAANADLPTLIHAAAELERTRTHGLPVMVTVPLHFSTMTRSAERQPYLAQCARLPEGDRRHLLFELEGCDETVPQTRLMELIGALAPYGRAVVLRVPLSRRRFAGIREARGFAVAADCSSLRDGDPRALEQMRAFTLAAGAAGLRCAGHGLASPALTALAIAAGFDFVDSDAIGPAAEQAGAARHFQTRELYNRIDAPHAARA